MSNSCFHISNANLIHYFPIDYFVIAFLISSNVVQDIKYLQKSLNLSQRVHEKMIDTKIIDSVEATTANLYKIWNLVVEENSLLKPNHVGFRCDGAAAMIGRKNSLSVHVQTKCPATIVIHC